jgi:hypothetical protein
VLLLELQVDGLEQNALAFSVFLLLAAVCWQRARFQAPEWRLSGRLVAVALVLVCLGLSFEAVSRGRVLYLNSQARAAVADWQNGHGDEEQARARVADLVAAAPDDPMALIHVWHMQNRTVRRAERSGSLGDASVIRAMSEGTRVIEAACLANPADPDLLRWLADWRKLLWRLAGRPPAMLMRYVDAIERLLVVDPLDVHTRWELALEAQRAGRGDLFEEQLAEMFKIEPDDAYAWFALGRFRMYEGRTQPALYAMCRAREAVFNCRIKLSVDSPPSREYYGRIIDQVDLESIRRNIHQLRRELLD